MTRLHGKTEEKAETMVHGDKHLTAKKYIYIYKKMGKETRFSTRWKGELSTWTYTPFL